MTNTGIVKLGNCLKCNSPVYIEHFSAQYNYGEYNSILLQDCAKGGDCEVDILKTPWAKRYRFAD